MKYLKNYVIFNESGSSAKLSRAELKAFLPCSKSELTDLYQKIFDKETNDIIVQLGGNIYDTNKIIKDTKYRDDLKKKIVHVNVEQHQFNKYENSIEGEIGLLNDLLKKKNTYEGNYKMIGGTDRNYSQSFIMRLEFSNNNLICMLSFRMSVNRNKYLFPLNDEGSIYVDSVYPVGDKDTGVGITKEDVNNAIDKTIDKFHLHIKGSKENLIENYNKMVTNMEDEIISNLTTNYSNSGILRKYPYAYDSIKNRMGEDGKSIDYAANMDNVGF